MSLKVSNISQSFSKKRILKDISFEATFGSVAAFLGPNGAGKTTLLKTVMGLHAPSTSLKKTSIWLGTQNITNLSVHKRVECGLVYVPQHTSLFAQMSVHDNLHMVYHYHPFWQNNSRPGGPAGALDLFKKEMYNLLKKINLEHALSQQARHLSGGQRRKVEIVRALLMHPKALLFDEPFAGVDPKSIYELKKIFVDLTKKNIAVVISDHHVDQLLSIATLVYVVINGEIITSGSIEEIMKDTHLKERYLGSQFHAEVAERFLS